MADRLQHRTDGDLPPNVAEADGAETRRMNRGGEEADRLAASGFGGHSKFGAHEVGCLVEGVRGPAKPAQVAVHMAPVMDASDDLLAGEAQLADVADMVAAERMKLTAPPQETTGGVQP